LQDQCCDGVGRLAAHANNLIGNKKRGYSLNRNLLIFLWRPQYERIRTFAEIPIEIPLNEHIPSHHTIAEKVGLLRQDGLSMQAIAERLRVAKKTVVKATRLLKGKNSPK
jgi:hypothetical protein